VEPLWRYGRPQAGRLREFRTFGIEVIGAAEPSADVEVIVIGNHFIRDLGLTRFELQVNSIGDEVCRPAYRQELLEYLERNRERLTDEHKDRFRENPLRVLDCKDEACRAVAAEAPKISERLCEACKAHFEAVQQGLEDDRVPYTHVPTLVRGLDYYTRTAFEFVSEVLSEQQATVCGGGRYDGLAEVLGGPPTPGVGFGSGVERILLALDSEGIEFRGESPIVCFVVAIGEVARVRALEVLRQLRAAGVPSEFSYESRPLGAQMKMADQHGARFAAIVGEREVQEGTATLRRMEDGHQETVPATDVAAWISAQR
jgi:histidyl-tRNA synthetase